MGSPNAPDYSAAGAVAATITGGTFSVPSADTANNITERDAIGNKADAAVTTVGVVASSLAYIKGVLNQLATLVTAATGPGTVFVVTKTLTSSAILQAGVDVTGTSSGALEVLNCILQTDGTGLAGGTNFRMSSNNASGAAYFITETVANLAANLTVDLSSASLVKQHMILESGKKIRAFATAADCTGAGVVTVYLVFRRVTAAATVAAS